MKCWIYQDYGQLAKRDASVCSWYVGWYDPDGRRRCKSCGPGWRGKDLAEKLARKIDAQLLTGTYESDKRQTWAAFKAEYQTKVIDLQAFSTATQTSNALSHFERLIKPIKMSSITTYSIDTYIAKRRTEKTKNGAVSPASINKELRHLRAALKKAAKWKYLNQAPDFGFLREPGKLPTYVPPEDFVKMYHACSAANRPKKHPAGPTLWWQALLVTAYMTGWRISTILGLRRDRLDLKAGTAHTLAASNKGKRDQKIPLHPIVIDHLTRLLAPVDAKVTRVFPWSQGESQLYKQLHLIQKAAGVNERYGFHDLRRAFATMNALNMTPDALQFLMQHATYTTTQLYINIAKQLTPTLQTLFAPDLSVKPKTDKSESGS